jgi:site-specific DNA-methyltransferase (adenine-specific)
MEIDNIYNMDCLEGMKQIPDGTIDLCVTDPPYLIETQGGGIYTQEDKQYVKELNDIKDGFRTEILDELCRVMKRINIYIFCSQKQIIPLTDYFVTKRGCNWNLLSWHKDNPVPACGNKYLTDTEYLLFFRQKGVKLYGNFDTKRTWFNTPLNQSDKEKWGHPTIKPLGIIRTLVFNSSMEGQTILDPFMGSGTTAIACIKERRHFIGFELSKEYFDKAVRRIKAEQAQLTLF